MSRTDVPLKRSLSTPEAEDDGVDLDASRIRGLQVELRRHKRRIRKLNTNLQGLQQETQQQKSALSYIERAWSQLQFELAQLLDGGNSHQAAEPTSASRLLELYLGAGSKFVNGDAARLAPLQMDLHVDEWATETEIENERRRIQQQKLEFDLAPLESTLQERLGKTRNAVVELLGRIDQGAFAASSDGKAEEFLAARVAKSEALAYRDLCVSLREQLMSAKLDLVVAEAQERRLNRMIVNGDLGADPGGTAAQNRSPTHSEPQVAAGSHASSDDGTLPAQKRMKTEEHAESKSEAAATATASDIVALEAQAAAQNAELQQRIEQLAEQLETSQAQYQKLQLELSKTESLRSGAEERTKQLYQENESLRQQLQAVGQKLNDYYNDMAAKLEQATQAAQHELTTLKAERNTLAEQVAASQVLQETVQSLQAQVANYHEVYQSHDNQLKLAEQHRNQAQQQAQSLNQQLEQALERERKLQQQLTSNESLDATVREALTETQAVATKAQAETRNLSNQINDLLTELDSIASDNRKLQAHNRQLIEQLGGADQQRLEVAQQVEMLRQANAAAQSQIDNLERRVQALKGLLEREEAFRENFKMHEAQLLQQLAGAQEAYARSQQEFFGMGQHAQMLTSTIEQHRLELQQAAAHQAQLDETIRNLQQQNTDLRQQLKDRRVETDGSSTQATGAAGAEADDRGLDATERQIYEKLRNMLKCSVCENRFKNTVIVRCGHLFCDQCVEGSLKSRNRKCPACKERFGQDDVKRVYLS